VAVLTLRIKSPFSVSIIEGFERLCDAHHPETCELCHGSGNHLGPHSVGSVLAETVRRWPNERVSQLPMYRPLT